MFPYEHYVEIVRRIDTLEADFYRLYRALERLRLDLQREWKVLPSGARWSESGQDASAYAELSHIQIRYPNCDRLMVRGAKA